MRFFEAGVLAFLWASVIAVHSDAFLEESGIDRSESSPLHSKGPTVKNKDTHDSRRLRVTDDVCSPNGVTYTPKKGSHEYTLIYLPGSKESRGFIQLLKTNSFFKKNWKLIMPFSEAFSRGYKWASLRREDVKGYRKSAEQIKRIIECEKKHGIESSKIVVGGYGQGGATAYLTGLEYGEPLLGLFGIASWVPAIKKIKISDAANNLPVLHLHGELEENMISEESGEIAVETMTAVGMSVESDSTSDVGDDLIQAEADAVVHYIQERIIEMKDTQTEQIKRLVRFVSDPAIESETIDSSVEDDPQDITA